MRALPCALIESARVWHAYSYAARKRTVHCTRSQKAVSLTYLHLDVASPNAGFTWSLSFMPWRSSRDGHVENNQSECCAVGYFA